MSLYSPIIIIIINVEMVWTSTSTWTLPRST